ncbi:MAG: S8 family peptidase, partial [Bacteroidota bacterium]
HVVGLVALMISANPALAGQVDLIEDLIEQTAVPKTIDDEDCGGVSGLEVPNNTYGYGRVDALAAVQAALNLTNTEDLLVESGVDVYPNPFSDAINIEFKELFGQLEFELYTATGQLVNNWAINAIAGEHQTFRMPDLSSGVYFYRINGEQGRVEGRIVKH